jgi:hypothetical protein
MGSEDRDNRQRSNGSAQTAHDATSPLPENDAGAKDSSTGLEHLLLEFELCSSIGRLTPVEGRQGRNQHHRNIRGPGCLQQWPTADRIHVSCTSWTHAEVVCCVDNSREAFDGLSGDWLSEAILDLPERW